MDERELTSHVLELLDDAAYRMSVKRVVGVHLEIGARRAINVERLHRVFSDAARGTVAEGARLWVQVLPLRRHCRNCGSTFDGTPGDVICPECNHPRTEDVSGEEVRVVNILVDEAA